MRNRSEPYRTPLRMGLALEGPPPTGTLEIRFNPPRPKDFIVNHFIIREGWRESFIISAKIYIKRIHSVSRLRVDIISPSLLFKLEMIFFKIQIGAHGQRIVLTEH